MARNTGRARWKHRVKADEEHEATTQDRQGTGPPVDSGRGGLADGGGRQRKKGTSGRDNPGADRDLVVKSEEGKGGATRLGKADTGLLEELLGLPSRGGKRRRAVVAGRRGRRPGGSSICARVIWEGEAGAKIERSGVYR